MNTTTKKQSPVEKHILENACTSKWLRSTFILAIQRDPVDALEDAEVLVTALRTRSIDAYDTGSPFNAMFTASVLRQHADALQKLANNHITDLSLEDNDRFRKDTNLLITQINVKVLEILTASQRLSQKIRDDQTRLTGNEQHSWGLPMPRTQ